jgi:hypothetical protein
MKKAFIKLSGLSFLLTGACLAEFQVGDGALQLDTSLTGVYDSNLRASVNNISDYYLSFQPTLRYRRLGARFTTEANAGVRIKRYLDNPSSDSDDADASFLWGMQRVDGHTTAASLNLRYFESNDAVLEVNDQVRTKTFSAIASGEVLVANRNLFSAGLTYGDSKRNLGSDQTTSNVRLGYGYLGLVDHSQLSANYSHLESKSTSNSNGLDMIDQKGDSLSAAYSRPLYADLIGTLTYGYRWLERGQQEGLLGLTDRQGSFYGVTFAGPFLPKQYFPKTTGVFRIAYEQSDTPGLNDRSGERLVGQLNLSWEARANTTVGLVASRSQELSILDQTVINEVAGVTLRQGIGQFVETNFSLTYTNADFVNVGRTDDRYEARAAATYKINRVWSSMLMYRYLNSESNQAIAHYTRHVVSGTVNYAF